MKHLNKNFKLKRKFSHKKSLLSNLSCQLIKFKIIKTTLIKAKALRQYLEPILTKSKVNTIFSRKIIYKYLKNKSIIKILFNIISKKIFLRKGGYLRIIKIGRRYGDNAKMALITFVDKF
ncbi:MAG: 50S ribosomal protein L17 [Candidatus Shikimatogenerans sp. Tder]|uniref:50S ribosomal protein L17 n=1 Tax=Candidatus Shikimatogenerans sp. Tder TaxID=3158566 RepID=A0AAU7QS60_9FLAO